MSFHKCGGNVGDNVTIPLPSWALTVMKSKGYQYTDQWGFKSEEYVHPAANHKADFPGLNKKRTMLEVYHDFMAAFNTAADKYISNGTINNI